MIAFGVVLAGLSPGGPARAQGETLAIEGGRITGAAADAQGIRRFLGIPYASPPVGRLRWRPLAPVVPWQGNAFGPDCFQPVRGRSADGPRWKGSEDCLYLNVWTPAAAGAKAPVFVWIHGGGSRMRSGAQP